MKKPTESDFADAATGAKANGPAKPGTAKAAQKSRKSVSAGIRNQRPRRVKKLRRASGIRETEEARALLQKQLHSLYWWIFHAFKMRGFIQAKALNQLQPPPNGSTESEQGDFVKANVSTKKQTL